MKLDRNANPDGRGKYALINLRTNTVEWGEEPFFVIKYKDVFAAPALRAYAHAIREHINALIDRLSDTNNVDLRPGMKAEVESLREYAREIEAEATKAATHPAAQIPT